MLKITLLILLVIATLFGSAFVQPGWSYSYLCASSTIATLTIQGGPLLDSAYALELVVKDNATSAVIIDNVTSLTYYTAGVSQSVTSSTGNVSIILYEKVRGATRLADDRIYEPVNICSGNPPKIGPPPPRSSQ